MENRLDPPPDSTPERDRVELEAHRLAALLGFIIVELPAPELPSDRIDFVYAGNLHLQYSAGCVWHFENWEAVINYLRGQDASATHVLFQRCWLDAHRPPRVDPKLEQADRYLMDLLDRAMDKEPGSPSRYEWRWLADLQEQLSKLPWPRKRQPKKKTR